VDGWDKPGHDAEIGKCCQTRPAVISNNAWLVTRILEHAEYDGADKGKGDIGGYDAQLTDERTKGHGNPPKVISVTNVKSAPLLATTHKLAIGFAPKKSALLSIHPISAAHKPCNVVKES
jgi:hypothetical protein